MTKEEILKKIEQLSKLNTKDMYLSDFLLTWDKSDDEISAVFETAEIAKFSHEQIDSYEDSLKSYRDLKNSLHTATEDGQVKGKIEGKIEGKIDDLSTLIKEKN